MTVFSVVLSATLGWGGCETVGNNNGNDGGLDAGPDGPVCAVECDVGRSCQNGECVANIPCANDNECQSDSYCNAGACVPYGMGPRGSTSPACTQQVAIAGLISPQIFCEWSGPATSDPLPNHKQVLTTPLVADFRFDGRAADAQAIKPSIVIVTYSNGTDGACGIGPNQDGTADGIIRILDGRTCQEQYVISSDRVNGATTPAIGDIDGDGRPDIVAVSKEGGLVAFRFDTGMNKFVKMWSSHVSGGGASNPIGTMCQWTGVALADLNDDGKPESLLEGHVYDETGLLVHSAGDLNASGSHGQGNFPVIADVDKNGVPDLVSARRLMAWNNAMSQWDVTKTFTYSSGYVAVADFGKVEGMALNRGMLDGVAEIVVVQAGNVRIIGLDGTVLFGPVSLPGSTGGGPPTVGDFDNDGRPEFAAAGSDSYSVYDPDCRMGATMEFCKSLRTDGILWTSVSQDHSSNRTGSSLFDFEGNGSSEAIYADECFARIYDGASGEVLFSQSHSSCTWNEYPVVADVEGNFRSKLIVPSNENCPDIMCPAVDPNFKGLRCMANSDCPNGLACDTGFCRCTMDDQCNTVSVGGGFVCRPKPAGVAGTGNTCQASYAGKRTGIRVFGDVLDRWSSSRPMWNQHTFSVTNILDSGTVPRTSMVLRNWEQTGLNNFRMNVQGVRGNGQAPDATARNAGTASCTSGSVGLRTSICNRGSAPLGDNFPVSFYDGMTLLCTGRTDGIMAPGQCLPAGCTTMQSGLFGRTLTIVADDDGMGGAGILECNDGNNRATMTVNCEPG